MDQIFRESAVADSQIVVVQNKNDISEYRQVNHVSSPIYAADYDNESEMQDEYLFNHEKRAALEESIQPAKPEVVVETFRNMQKESQGPSHEVSKLRVKPLELSKLQNGADSRNLETMDEGGGAQSQPEQLLTLRNHEIFQFTQEEQNMRDSNLFSQCDPSLPANKFSSDQHDEMLFTRDDRTGQPEDHEIPDQQPLEMNDSECDHMFREFQEKSRRLLDNLAQETAESKKRKSKNATHVFTKEELMLSRKYAQESPSKRGAMEDVGDQTSLSSRFKDISSASQAGMSSAIPSGTRRIETTHGVGVRKQPRPQADALPHRLSQPESGEVHLKDKASGKMSGIPDRADWHKLASEVHEDSMITSENDMPNIGSKQLSCVSPSLRGTNK